MHEPVMAKQLGELLREQQEPFILEIYLLERGYLKKSGSWGPKSKRREVIPGCSNIVTAVVNKLVESFRNSRKAKNSASGDGNHGDQEIGRRSDPDTAYSEGLSSYSGTTVFHSCSGSETEGRTGSPQADCLLPFKITNLVEANELTGKRVLQESKQLLFDCMRELVETQESEGGTAKEYPAILGPVEIWKILGEDTRTWNKLSGNETNTTQLMHLDFAASAKKWKGFKTEMREIGAVIGDAILEDLCAEITADMILN